MVKKALTLLTSILFALPLLMPFNIYASQETIIVPTWYSSSVQQEWQSKVQVKNYCEGTNSSTASCQLTFNVNGNYYGYIYFDGYHNNQFILDYQPVFISGGQGKYYYNIYQNAIIDINKVSIQGLNLVQPQSNVDLSQIIQLLTSINSYNQQEVGNQTTQIQQLQTVINDLIISNGYLETLTKLRQWNIPFESYPIVSYMLSRFESNDIYNTYMNNYPVFEIKQNDIVFSTYGTTNGNFYFIFIIDRNAYNVSQLSNIFTFSREDVTFSEVSYFARGSFTGTRNCYLVKATIHTTTNNQFTIKYNLDTSSMYVPVYYNGVNKKNISTDFALQYDLTNKLLDDLELIANGTTASQSAADSSQSANEQLQTDSNTLFQQENGFKSDMNNAMQNVNNTFRLQDMGTKFISSAQWVRTQYEQLTNNTPFASLITFSLITGLALILLGKVYK